MSMQFNINGKSFEGANSGTINIGIDSIANSFNAVLTNFWASSITDIKAGDSVEIYANDKKRFTGWIDKAKPAIGSDGNLINISGRSKTGDLIDCTPDATQSEFKNQKLESLINALASPFGITVSSNVDTGNIIETANYEQGETILDFIKDEAIKKGLLLYSNSDGNIVIDRAGTVSSGLNFIEGENILDCSASVDYSNRYSKYIVKGDQQSNSFISEEDSTQAQAIAIDSEVRHRPLIIIVDGVADNDICLQRAKWEATIRQGKSITYSVKLQGWYFNLNQTCVLQSERIGAKSENLLISRIINSFSPTGKICEMELVNPDTYAQPPQLKLDKSKKENPYFKEFGL